MHANHMKAIAKLAGGMLFLLPGILLPSRSFSAEKPIELGVTLPLTGADAEDAKLVEQGFAMAIDEANEKHENSRLSPGATHPQHVDGHLRPGTIRRRRRPMPGC